MKLHDFRADFRKGRVGSGLRVRPDTKAYTASLRDADNMMVLNNGHCVRRWGTLNRLELDSAARIEIWAYDAAQEQRTFFLVFEDAELTIYDMTFAQIANFTGQPWTATTKDFLQLAYERRSAVITDETFRTRLLEYDPFANTFSIREFEFEISTDEQRIAAPFFPFVDKEMKVYLTIFTSKGTSTGYSQHIVDVTAFDAADFDLEAGTGLMQTEVDFFVTAHEGTRMRVGGGELEITSVVNARAAEVQVWKDIAIKLDVNPFFLRKGSNIVEVAAFDHGFKVGDKVMFLGLAEDEASTLLHHAPRFAADSSTAVVPSGTAAAYVVQRVVDKDHFEVYGGGSGGSGGAVVNIGASWDPRLGELPTWNGFGGAGGNPTNNILAGGGDVLMLPLDGMRGIQEPAFSDARGWPQACVVHERRLWLGGTQSLPDAAWGSQFGQFESFDTGDGSPADAVALYGIGEQTRVRHLVSRLDLLIFTDKAEFYVPGNPDVAITQETARVLPATKHGAAYTRPIPMDGGVFFVDAPGHHIRELASASREVEYTAPPATVVTEDWVSGPVQAAYFQGAPVETTPYALWVNSEDGSLLVMHASRSDDAFGFMRWTLKTGTFISVAATGRRLFCVAQREDATFWLLEFDTAEDYCTTDFSVRLGGGPNTNWSAPDLANLTVHLEHEGRTFVPVTVAGNGDFSTPEPLVEVFAGLPSEWSAELSTPVVATGQGMKAGKNIRLVSCEIHWIQTVTGTVAGESILDGYDIPELDYPTPVDQWREYHIGEWGREPVLQIGGETPGHAGFRAITMNAYV